MAATAEDRWASIVDALRSASPETVLATHNRAAREVSESSQSGNLPADVQALRVAVLRSATVEVLINSIVASLAEHRFAAQVAIGRLGNIAHEILHDDSFVYAESFDVCVVLALAEHVLPGLLAPSDASPKDEAIETFISQVMHLADRFSGLVIICNLAWPASLLTPHLQAQTPAGGRYAVAQANRRLAELASEKPNLVVCDLEALVFRLGADRFYSPRDALAALQPFSAVAIPALARELADLCMLYRSTPVKCIVLDCDNTLWGGIIGEDGLSGIQLGETYPGLCYHQFQRQLDELNRLGFLLAINSRNNQADVQEAFDQHPGMVLRMEQIAAARINWQDKATNMRELADDLNIGLDSFVFIDDSDFEIDLIRDRHPEVHCLPVPRQPWRLPALLPQSRLIDRLVVTPEDRHKARMYAQERRRKQLRHEAVSLDDYLRGLGIQMKFEPFDRQHHLARTAQLTQKTNQFNLTTRRYTEADILEMADRGAALFLAALSDRFGDHGRIALAIVRPAASPKTCRLDTFLLSCRVIGRGIEDSFLRLVMQEAKRAGFETFAAEFVPTAKNAPCREFLPKNDFVEIGRATDEHACYEFDLTRGVPPIADWITIR